MAWLEMSRTPDSRPEGWRAGECLWSPRRKEDGTRWGFWETMMQVQRGDVVFHLCGDSHDARFTGFSIAAEDCRLLEWAPSGPQQIYHVTLQNFCAFETPLLWSSIKVTMEAKLLEYFAQNRALTSDRKERLFYVLQAGRIQCLNGAYLSYLSDSLVEILFGLSSHRDHATTWVVAEAASASAAYKTAAIRVGQSAFSHNVRSNFGWECCFPGCPVSDRAMLVGSHIARWADAKESRGLTENGLCLCVLHDRAFEIGAFTIDDSLRVCVDAARAHLPWVNAFLASGNGREIKPSVIRPSSRALHAHRERTRI